ncbi:MAG: hypothetical protein IKC22_02900 [Bacilli bacterium]|nr:hypothetical protein [Bacilli bacterium]
MNTLIIITLILLLIYYIFSLKITLYLNKDEKLHIWFKIGKIFRFRVNESKLIKKLLDDINLKDISKIQYDSFMINNLLKYITVEKITVIEKSNILSDTWNIYSSFILNYMNSYLHSLLNQHFYKVNDVYYSISYDTVGSFGIYFELVLSLKITKLLKYLIRRKRYNEQRNERNYKRFIK